MLSPPKETLIQEVLCQLTLVISAQVSRDVCRTERVSLGHKAEGLKVRPGRGDGLPVEVKEGAIPARVNSPDDLARNAEACLERHGLGLAQCAELTSCKHLVGGRSI